MIMNLQNTVSRDLASAAERYKANSLDIIIFVISFLISIPLANQLLSRVDHAEFTVLWMVFYCVGYENIPVRLWGQTLGMKIMGLKMVDAQGKRPGILPILHRWFLKLMLGKRAYRIASNGESIYEIHDKAAGVFVVRARRP
jgi:uncharacterized RDD family membrane protein YckC